MSSPAASLATDPTDALLDEIEATYERGRYLDAFRGLRALGHPLTFAGTRARVLAARILGNLGARRIASFLAIRAHRQDRTDPTAAYYYSGHLAEARGSLAALRFLERFGAPAHANDEERALLLLQQATLRAAFRDFERADALAEEAGRRWDHPWLWVERATLAAQADRWQDARRAAEHALSMAPTYRPALQVWAGLLASHGELPRACELLAERGQNLQAPMLFLQLARLWLDLSEPQKAHEALIAGTSLMWWPEEPLVTQTAALAAAIAYKRGDLDAAVMFGRMNGHPMSVRVAERLAAAPPAREVLLPVPYVRQDHKTCAPATMTSLCRTFGHPADHIAIVEEICYDGTPSASQRHWAEEHGLVARHFTLTWDAAVALLDRGVPFALQTIETGSAHLQAVVGYDVRRRSFHVRDPSVPLLVEMDADALLERQRFAGPQCLALVPRDRASLLEGVLLPDAGLHDRLYRIERALERHDRSAAQAEVDGLVAEAPGHAVTIAAARALAAYDGNQSSLLAAHEACLAQHPDAEPPSLWRLGCLANLQRAAERTRELARAASRPGADPLFARLWAEDLAGDARTAALAGLHLTEVARRRHDARAFAGLARIASTRGEEAEAYELHRIAACLELMDEQLAWQMFFAARVIGKTEEALRFLEDRATKLGAKAAGPWRTLHDAYEVLDRRTEAARTLDRALAARPDDGDVLLFAAEVALGSGALDRAKSMLERAQGRVREIDSLRITARLEKASGARLGAMERWRTVLAHNPLSVEAHAAFAQLVAEERGTTEARAHLLEVATRHPHHAGLARLLVDFTPDEGEDGVEVVRRLVELAPGDAWAHRELALRLKRRHRLDEARAALAEAAQLDPDGAATHGVRGFVLAAAGERGPARDAFREALRRAADYVAAFDGLLDEADDEADRLRALRFLQGELRRQVVFGDGLHAFRRNARGILPDDEVLAFLEEARAARPELLDSWTSVVHQLLETNRLDEARRVAREAVERFPLVPEAMLTAATVEEARQDPAARREMLERCLAAHPGHPRATRELAETLDAAGEVDTAKRLLTDAVARFPLDVAYRGVLALLLDKHGDGEGSLATLEGALVREPEYAWAWERLVQAATDPARRDRALAVADAVASARPHAGAAHLGRGRLLATLGRLPEALTALDAAIGCDPRLCDAHDQRAVVLMRLGRREDALAACHPPAFAESPPVPLRGRRAWLLHAFGQVDEAIAAMEEVVADAPAYGFGLGHLAEWQQARGNLAQAQRWYSRLLVVAPGDPDASLGLFDVAMDLGDHDVCALALDGARTNGPSAFVQARRVLLACARRQRREAEEAFRALCALPQPNGWPLATAGKALARLGAGRFARTLLEATVRETPPQHTEAAAAWGLLSARGPLVSGLRGLHRMLLAGEATAEAAANFVENLVDEGETTTFWVTLAWFRARLAATTRVWGAVGYGLVKLGFCWLALRWMRGWQAREGVRPWMLNNLAAALREKGRWSEADAVARHSLSLPPDHATDQHVRWAAFGDAVEGRIDEAKTALAKHPPADDDRWGQLLCGYVEALAEAQHGEGSAAERGRVARERAADLERRFVLLSTSTLGRHAKRRVRRRLKALRRGP